MQKLSFLACFVVSLLPFHFCRFLTSLWFSFPYYRWKRFEIHDIVIECAKVSLDPREASCEEGYATLPEHFCANLHMRASDCTASPYTDLHSSYGTFSIHIFSLTVVTLCYCMMVVWLEMLLLNCCFVSFLH